MLERVRMYVAAMLPASSPKKTRRQMRPKNVEIGRVVLQINTVASLDERVEHLRKD